MLRVIKTAACINYTVGDGGGGGVLKWRIYPVLFNAISHRG